MISKKSVGASRGHWHAQRSRSLTKVTNMLQGLGEVTSAWRRSDDGEVKERGFVVAMARRLGF